MTTPDHGDQPEQYTLTYALPPAPGYGCRISLERIILMSVLSLGFYVLYWMYLTWKQYQDHTGRPAYPVWHALTLCVPVYGWFRFYAHVKDYRDLMEPQDVENNLRIRVIMGVAVFITILCLFGGDVTPATMMFSLVRTATTIFVLYWIQSNINRYWEILGHRYGEDYAVSRRPARIGKGEIVIGTIGAIWWLLVIAGFLNLFPEHIVLIDPG